MSEMTESSYIECVSYGECSKGINIPCACGLGDTVGITTLVRSEMVNDFVTLGCDSCGRSLTDLGNVHGGGCFIGYICLLNMWNNACAADSDGQSHVLVFGTCGDCDGAGYDFAGPWSFIMDDPYGE